MTPRILLAEDNPINQEVIKGFLKLRGWTCECVGDGKLAVEALQTHSYDLVLMDVQMPNMDGLEATRQIRKLRAPVCEIPIVAMTANAMRSDERVCLESGMDGYASKPINKDAFFGEMDRVLSRSSSDTVKRTGTGG